MDDLPINIMGTELPMDVSILYSQLPPEILNYLQSFKVLFEKSVDGYAFGQMIFEEGIAKDFIYLDTNLEFEKLTGHKNVSGRKISELLKIEEPLQAVINIYGEVAKTGIGQKIEMFSSPLNLILSIMSPAKGYFVSIFDNITSKKIVEHNVSESEKKWRTLFTLLPVGVSILDKAGKISEYNDALSIILEIDRSDLQHEKYNNRKYIHPDFTPFKEEEFPSYIAVKEQHIVKDVEMGVIKDDGNVIWLEVSATPLSLVNATCTIVTKNITLRKYAEMALKISELKFKSLVANIPGAVYHRKIKLLNKDDLHLDSDFGDLDPVTFFNFRIQVSYFSESVLDLTGYTSEDFVQGKIIFANLIHPSDRDKAGAKAIVALKCRGEYELEYRIKHQNDEWIWVTERGKVSDDETGNFVFLDGVILDINKRKLAEIKLKKSSNELNNLNSDKKRLISVLAHDLKNPFNSILGFLNLLKLNLRKYDIEKIEHQLNYIDHGIRNVYNLLEELLLWASTQSEKLSFEPFDVNIYKICNEILADLEIQRNSKNIVFELNVSNEINVFADLAMLKIVLRNLISNALKFTQSGGVITIYATRNNQNSLVKISDNGVGIAPEKLPLIFDASHMRSSIGTANERGSGLGLIICKEFIEKHSGEIWVKSEIGKGTDFMFTLPNKYL